MLSLSGCVDQAKAASALMGYRVRWCAVVFFAFAANFAALYVVFQNLAFACVLMVFYISGIVSSILLNESRQLRRHENLSAEFSQPKTSEYECYKTLWEEACANAGFRSGGVYVVTPDDPLAESRHTDSFGVSHPMLLSNKRALFIRAEMLGKFTLPQMKAIVLHEYGHMRWMPLLLRYAADIATFPPSVLLSSVSFVRSRSPQRPVVVTLYFVERVLHFISLPRASQIEEYAADAYAAQQMGTAKHLISALLRLQKVAFARIGHEERRNMGAKRVRDAHLHTHPLTPDRILHLRALHGGDHS